MTTHLTSNFTVEELCKSDTALRKGIDNTPPPDVMSNLFLTADRMEVVRRVLGDNKIHINSGYRCKKLNSVIGGSKTSAHMNGLAVDFVCPDFGTPYDIAMKLSEVLPADFYDQIIYEGAWVHIGFAWDNCRNEDLTAKFDTGKAVYTKGIHK